MFEPPLCILRDIAIIFDTHSCGEGFGMRGIWAIAILFCATVFAGEFEIADQAAFEQIVDKDAKVEKLGGDMKFTEGPVWVAAGGGYLIFSDIPSNQLKKWTAKDG